MGVELPLFGKESSGTPVYKILVRALFYLHKLCLGNNGFSSVTGLHEYLKSLNSSLF